MRYQNELKERKKTFPFNLCVKSKHLSPRTGTSAKYRHNLNSALQLYKTEWAKLRVNQKT